MSTDELEPLLSRAHGQRLRRRRRARRASENGIDSSSSLRDSIFEKSRMSLRIVSSDSADCLTVSRQSRCSASSSVSSASVGHADDAVHRRADLVAHVRQELGLRAVGGLRRLLQRRLGVQLAADDGRLRLHAPPQHDDPGRAPSATTRTIAASSHSDPLRPTTRARSSARPRRPACAAAAGSPGWRGGRRRCSIFSGFRPDRRR